LASRGIESFWHSGGVVVLGCVVDCRLSLRRQAATSLLFLLNALDAEPCSFLANSGLYGMLNNGFIRC
jgi:hypothetical protein